MGLIADECPQCNRVTRCLVTERGGFVGGLVFGIPFVLPLSSVHCVCGECGHEFHSRSGAEDRAVPPEVAAGLDIDGLLALTNPDLWQAQTLSRLRADPRLQDAFLLLDRLAPGPLRFGLRAAVARWPALGEPDRADLLGRVEACRRAEGFARSMAGQYTIGAAGCLAGVAVAAGVWVAAGLTFVGLGTSGLGPGRRRRPGGGRGAGLAPLAGPGPLVGARRSTPRGRPGGCPARVGARGGRGDDGPSGGRGRTGRNFGGIGPALRAELAPGVGALRAGSPGSGRPPAVIVCPGCGAKVRVPVDGGAALGPAPCGGPGGAASSKRRRSAIRRPGPIPDPGRGRADRSGRSANDASQGTRRSAGR